MTVTIYTRPDCGDCERTKKLLDKLDVTYTEIGISEAAPPPEGFLKAPIVVTDSGSWSGFRYDKIKALRMTHGGGE